MSVKPKILYRVPYIISLVKLKMKMKNRSHK